MKSNLANTLQKARGTAISYARFSSAAQSDGDSLNRQSLLTETYCRENCLDLLEGRQYLDKGVSAFTGKNKTEGQLAALLEDAESGKFPIGTKLIVESFDRLGRDNMRDQFLFFTRLLKAGLTIVTFDGGYPREYRPDRDNDIGELLMVLVPMLKANEESRLKGERVRQAWGGKRERAPEKILTKVAPYWLTVKDDKFVAVEERAAVVREIFKLSKAGHGKRSIAKMLNARNEPVWSSIKRNPLRIWRESYVEKILTNIAVIGNYQPHVKIKGKRIPEGEVIKGYFPALMSEEEFFAATSRRQGRKGKAGRSVNQANNLFAGLARCVCCGGPLYYRNKGKGWVYLTCEMKSLKHWQCNSLPVPYALAESAILENLIDVDWVSILDPGQRIIASDFAAMLQGKLRDTERRLDNLVALAEEGSISSSKARERLAALQSEKESLESKLRDNAKSQEERFLLDKLSEEAATFMAQIKSGDLAPAQRLSLKTNISQLVDGIYIRRTESGETHFIIIFINGSVSMIKIPSKLVESAASQDHFEVSSSADSAFAQVHPESLAFILGEPVANEFAIMRKNTHGAEKRSTLSVYNK